ncbi:MAG: hypothetical protein ACLFO2_00015 [Candidatus Woesearchaeota archaeon]
MGLVSRLLLIVILVLTFLPKHNGTVICFGCEDRECACFGIPKSTTEGSTCYGIPYGCEEKSENPVE